MKKRITLLVAIALLAVVGVQAAAVQKQITLTFADDAANGITWVAGSNTVDGTKVTFSGDWSASGWEFDAPVHVTGFTISSLTKDVPLTLEFKDADNKVNYEHQWDGNKANVYENANELAFGLTETTADWKKITSIKFNPRHRGSDTDSEKGSYVTFGTITLTIEVTGYDEVFSIPSKYPQDLSTFEVFYNYGTTADWNFSTNTLTAVNINGQYGLRNLALTVADYDKLVVKYTFIDAKPWYTMFRVDNGGDPYYGVWTDAENIGEEKTIEIDLTSGLTANNLDGTGETTAITTISRIYFFSMGDGKIKISDIYLQKGDAPVYYLVRNNTAADQYGTICLPFAASKPSNATVYDVVGYSKTGDNPSALYLQAVDALEAGKAYMFKSTDAEDITFTKTGTDADLASPAASVNMLHGQFSGTDYVPVDSYIFVGTKWKKVTVANQNTVSNYRAYLTLTDDLLTTAPVNAAVLTLGFNDGETTGIGATLVNSEEIKDKSYYDLQGRRVSQPTKGIYVKNGKKVIIK